MTTLEASSDVRLVSTEPWALMTLPTVTSLSVEESPDLVKVVDEPTKIVRLNPSGSLMVMVSPLTAVTVPNRTGSCTSMFAAVVELDEESWIPTCWPTANCDSVIVVGPSLKVVADVMAYDVDVPLMSFTVIEVSDTAVTVPPAKFPAPGGDGDVVVVASCAVCVDAADATPTPPATSPTPSAVVAAARLNAIFLFMFMLFLSLRSSETISNDINRARVV